MDLAQLEGCIGEYGKEVYAFCSRLTKNRQEAEDLYQETFLKAFEKRERMDINQNPKSYLISIALRIWKNKRRKFAWRRRIEQERFSGEETGEVSRFGAGAEEAFLLAQQRRLIRQAVDALEERLRLPVYLYYIAGCPVEEIGKILGIPPGTVKSRLYKARILLRKKLEVLKDDR